jgi:small GTP-binding protein
MSDNPFFGAMAEQASTPPVSRPRTGSSAIKPSPLRQTTLAPPPPPIQKQQQQVVVVASRDSVVGRSPELEEVVLLAAHEESHALSKLQPDREYKICIMGKSAVGKTSLLRRYCAGKFLENSKSTIGVECYYRVMRLGNLIVRFALWDTAGQERFDAFTSQYLRGAIGLICVFDVNLATSFEGIEKYIDQFYMELKVKSDELAKSGEEIPPVLLIANKMDVDVSDNGMRREAREGLLTRAKDLAMQQQWHMADLSAKTGSGVETALNTFLQVVHRYKQTKQRLTSVLHASDSRVFKAIPSLRSSGMYDSNGRQRSGSAPIINVVNDNRGGTVPVSVTSTSSSTTVILPRRDYTSMSMDEVIEVGSAVQQQKKTGCGC